VQKRIAGTLSGRTCPALGFIFALIAFTTSPTNIFAQQTNEPSPTTINQSATTQDAPAAAPVDHAAQVIPTPAPTIENTDVTDAPIPTNQTSLRQPQKPQLLYGLWVLAPAVIAIILAIITRQVVPALVVGLLAGAY